MSTIARDLNEFQHAITITITIMPHARTNEELAQPSRLQTNKIGIHLRTNGATPVTQSQPALQ
ncbi:hypothetical protein [Caballeronia sp. HLA56]